ncbi:protein rhomboid isoform X1 [Lucilia sericata]|uniref:protein rhomboid isoform X1 n=1 Tax=Lucilia sericata TaxID=13632 RepID=UPI0018A8029E|nr:protein rhomboid isoform X1 [Lucilia sericata]
MINSLIVNNEINKEDLNRNLLFRIENSCEITSACDKCNMNTETNSNLLSDHEQIERKDFIDDLEYNKRIWKVPWFILIMCFLQISLYCIANACMRQQLMFMPETINDYWRYFTYMLLHSDVLHLSMNVCLQFVIGFCLESEQGHLRVACIYIIGGIAGSLATLYLQPQLSLMGASAGVYAMLMSHIPHLLKNFHNLPQRYLRILSMVILFISDMCFTTFHVLINHNTNPRICLEAHAAGAISGLVFGFLIYKTNSKKSTFVGGRLKTLPRGRDDQHV